VGQVGAVPRPLSNEPEVVVRFVDRVRLPSGVRFIGLDEAAFDDDRFYVLRGKGRARTAVQVAFEGIGERCEIVCESGTRHVPLLVAIVNMTALSKGFLPLHASAFSYDGTGVLVMGWTKGGKTETLLAFMANGAAYIGDEWVYLAADGGRMYGLSQPITVWDWHLDDLPRYRALLGRRERSRLMASRVVQGVKREAPARVIRSRAVDRVLGLAEGQLSARISPAELFGSDSCLPHARLNKVFLLHRRLTACAHSGGRELQGRRSDDRWSGRHEAQSLRLLPHRDERRLEEAPGCPYSGVPCGSCGHPAGLPERSGATGSHHHPR
jgi:hypothetical protein